MHHRTTLVVFAAIAALVAVAAASASRLRVVDTAKNAKLGKTVLVTLSGRTLYTLSAERNGKFICVAKTCLSFWHPLVVPAGTTPTGVGDLATIRRPDGRRQVTFRGGPLYTFAGDHSRGDAKGEGFKDVGVWHAASTDKTSSPPTTTGGGGGYHY